MKFEKFRSLRLYSFSNSLLILFMLLSVNSCAAMSGHPQPTAIVIDADTGQPIEGAVAIAIWRKHSATERAWWEGGTMVVVRVEEAVSDAQGRIYIDGFWGSWYLFENRYPRLTIYKPEYICWDQKNIFIPGQSGKRRTDFNSKKRIAKLKKWPENFSFNRHSSFVSTVTMGDAHEASQKKFVNAFDYERKFRIDESTRINKARKDKKREKRGDNDD
jgi:hypothetical protein